MSELIVIGYDSAEKAEDARAALMGMSREYLVDVADAVVATADAKGTIRLNQMVNLWTMGAASGSFWGLLIGLLFLHPLLGVLVGASAGALSGALGDYGIDDAFMRKVAELLKPGQAALFIMARQSASDRVIAQLSEYGGDILRTNLDTTQEDKLRAVFAASHDEAHRQQAETKVAK